MDHRDGCTLLTEYTLSASDQGCLADALILHEINHVRSERKLLRQTLYVNYVCDQVSKDVKSSSQKFRVKE